eukprot:s1620_g24.t1
MENFSSAEEAEKVEKAQALLHRMRRHEISAGKRVDLKTAFDEELPQVDGWELNLMQCKAELINMLALVELRHHQWVQHCQYFQEKNAKTEKDYLSVAPRLHFLPAMAGKFGPDGKGGPPHSKAAANGKDATGKDATGKDATGKDAKGYYQQKGKQAERGKDTLGRSGPPVSDRVLATILRDGL